MTVHGELVDGRHVTLLGCGVASRSFGVPARFPDHWHVARSLIGSWTSDPSVPAFSSLRASIAGLAQAVGRSGLNVTSTDITRSDPEDRLTVTWERPEPIVARFGTRTLTLRPHPRLAPESDYRLTVSSDVVAVVAGGKPLSLDDADRVVSDLVTLVATATESAASVRRLDLIPTEDGPTVVIDARERPWYGPDPELTVPRFTFDSLGAGTERFVSAFADFRHDQPEAAELLFEYQVFHAVLTPPDRLLYLARFLEAFHRRRNGTRTSFVERVAALLENAGPAAATAFGGSAAALAEAIRDTRDYYVHYDPSWRARAHHEVALDGLADRTWCVVRAVLWADLEMDEDRICEVLATDWRYTAAAREPLVPPSPPEPEPPPK